MTTRDHDRGTSNWTLVTVTYNSAAHLLDHWTDAPIGDARWLVIDNASTDGSADVAASLGAEVVRLPRNAGFSAANNVGLKLASSEWIGFINPDVAVVGADLDRIAATSRACNGLVAPQLVNDDGTNQANARGMPYLVDKFANRSLYLPGSQLSDYIRTDLKEPTYIAWAMGAALLGPTSTFIEVGGWDEGFFIYYEDHDIGLRAWLNGRTVVLDPKVRWNHQWQRATTLPRLTPWRHEVQSMRRFYSKYPQLLTRGRFRRNAHSLDVLQRRIWAAAP